MDYPTYDDLTNRWSRMESIYVVCEQLIMTCGNQYLMVLSVYYHFAAFHQIGIIKISVEVYSSKRLTLINTFHS